MDIRKELMQILKDGEYHTYSELQSALKQKDGFSKEIFDEELRYLICRKDILLIDKNLYMKNMVIRELSHEIYVAGLQRVKELMSTMGVRPVDMFEGMNNYELAKAIMDIKKILDDVLKNETEDLKKL